MSKPLNPRVMALLTSWYGDRTGIVTTDQLRYQEMAKALAAVDAMLGQLNERQEARMIDLIGVGIRRHELQTMLKPHESAVQVLAWIREDFHIVPKVKI